MAPSILANLCRLRGWQCATSLEGDDGKALCSIITKVGHLTASFSGPRGHDSLWTTAGRTIRVANIYGPSSGLEGDLLVTGCLTRDALLRAEEAGGGLANICPLYTSPSPRDRQNSRMPSSA